eukprot:COSAG02_NODE_1891_length_10485_cov_3.034469_2_plen_94_part_00
MAHPILAEAVHVSAERAGSSARHCHRTVPLGKQTRSTLGVAQLARQSVGCELAGAYPRRTETVRRKMTACPPSSERQSSSATPAAIPHLLSQA